MNKDPQYALLGKTIAAYFQEHGAWPLVRWLQKEFKSFGSIERLAADAPPDLMICHDSSNQHGHCQLTLRGFDQFVPGSSEVQFYLGAVRHAAKRFLEGETPPVITGEELRRELGISTSDLRKLGRLILDWSGFWSQAIGPDVHGDFSFTPNQEAWYYEEVHSVSDFFAARDRAHEDLTYASRKRYENSWDSRTTGSAFQVRETAPRYVASIGFEVSLGRFDRVRNASLRSLLVADAREINRLFGQGLWKSVGFLAGSCCEGILIDLLEREEPRTSTRLGTDWRTAKGLSHLVSAAHAFGLVNEHTTDLAKFLKRWRDLIHPWRAANHATPTREVALSILALLEWLLAETDPPRLGDAEEPVSTLD